MARRLIILAEADHDLDSIWSFIATNNPRAADAMIDRLTEAFDMLLTMPLAGRIRHEFGKDLRSFPVGSYMIFYKATSRGIEVARVMSGRQDIDADDVK
jgi:toxin ParE1/3/4